MDDPQIHGTIEQLVAEEHELWERESAGNASRPDAASRVEGLARPVLGPAAPAARLLREADRNRSAADVRGAEVVEHYE